MSVLAATRVGTDSAGGLITGNLKPHVQIGGKGWAVIGAAVSSHGSPPHFIASVSTGSTFVRLDGVAPAAAGHLATCGHVCTGTGHVKIAS